MPDNRTPAQRHDNMAAIHSASTNPEKKLRAFLWRQGLRYRINDKRLPGSPDIVLPKYHSVIFVHGCFWHGHNGCKYYTIPKTNTEFWTAKVARNKERDQEVWRQLEAKGWCVIIVWECELKKVVLDDTVARVRVEILANGEAFRVAAEERRLARRVYLEECRKRKERDKRLKAELQSGFHNK